MLCELTSYLHIYETHMSPALNESSAVWRFEHGDVIKICSRIIFKFYMGLSRMLSYYCQVRRRWEENRRKYRAFLLLGFGGSWQQQSTGCRKLLRSPNSGSPIALPTRRTSLLCEGGMGGWKGCESTYPFMVNSSSHQIVYYTCSGIVQMVVQPVIVMTVNVLGHWKRESEGSIKVSWFEAWA